jgi:hypothetical protein
MIPSSKPGESGAGGEAREDKGGHMSAIMMHSGIRHKVVDDIALIEILRSAIVITL